MAEMMHVRAVPVPTASSIAEQYATMHLADAFAMQLPEGASSDPEVLARFLVASQPAWIAWLTRLRDLIVSVFGLKTAKHLATLSDRIGIFKVYSSSPTEIVLGEDDMHLNFRVSMLCSGAPDAGRQVVVSTVVQCHNLLGRCYIFIIAPFHRMVVKASLRRAARLGWPAAAH